MTESFEEEIVVETLQVHAYDWTVEDSYTDDDNLAIHAWCMDKDSVPYLLRINDFPAFCHIELPMFVKGRPYNWTQTNVERLTETLSYMLKEHAPQRVIYKRSKKTYYYHGNRTFPMMLYCFKNMEAMKHCENVLKDAIKTDEWGYIKCNVWESGIPIVRKLLTIQKTTFSGWFECEAYKTEDDYRLSVIDNEYIINWQSMRPIDPDVCKGWMTNPRVVSIDGEMYSSNKNRMPDKYDIRDVCYMVSVIYKRLNDPDSLHRYAVIYGDCEDIPEDKLANCTIIRTDSEFGMIEEVCRLIRELDPEVVSGYNILSYDYPYLNHRVKRDLKKWPQAGRIIGKRSHLTGNQWKSGAYGHQNINILRMDGRISVDMLPIIKRDHKLVKYDLDTVSKHFLGKGKHDVPAKEMFRIYERNMLALRIYNQILEELEQNPGAKITKNTLKRRYQAALEEYSEAKKEMTKILEYCIRDSELVIDLMEKLTTWIGLVELSNIVGVTITELFTQGQQIRCMSQLYDLASRCGNVLDARDVPGYRFSGGFVYEPIPGLYENVICLDFASLYPTIIMAYNICYTTLVPPELFNEVSDEYCHIIEFDQEEPMYNANEDGDTDDMDDADQELDEELDEMMGEKSKKIPMKMVHHVFKFMKAVPNENGELDGEGLIPRLVRYLVSERKKVKKLMEAAEKGGDTLMQVVYNQRQLALKVSANSFFGFLGVHNNGRMPLIEGAMSITAKGRELITMVNDYLEKKYGAKVVYNDTDSSMVSMGITDRKEAVRMGHILEQELNGMKKGQKDYDGNVVEEDTQGIFLPPIRFEFEKAMRMLCIRKKKYAAYLINKDGTFKTKKVINADGEEEEVIDMMTKGIILARRDFPNLLRKIYDKILRIVMDRKPFNVAFTALVDYVQELIDKKIGFDDFKTVKGLGANYKSDSYFMKVFSDELRRDGKLVNPGDRLEYVVVVDKDGRKLLGQKMRTPEQYFERLNTDRHEELDLNYYLENVLTNAVNQLFEVGYKDVIEKLKHIGFKPSNRHKFIGLSKPVTILVKMLQRGHDIHMFKEAVQFNVERLGKPKKLVLNVVSGEQNHTNVVENDLPPQVEESHTVEPRLKIKRLKVVPPTHKSSPAKVSPPKSSGLIRPKIFDKTSKLKEINKERATKTTKLKLKVMGQSNEAVRGNPKMRLVVQ